MTEPRTITAEIHYADPDGDWQDIDVVLPGIGILVLQKQGDALTEWGISFEKSAYGFLFPRST